MSGDGASHNNIQFSSLTNPNLPSTRNASGEGRDSGGGFGSRDAVLGEKEGRSGKRVGKVGKG